MVTLLSRYVNNLRKDRRTERSAARQTLRPPQRALAAISKRSLVICTPPDARGSILRDCNHLWRARPTGRQGRIKAPFAGTICSTPFLKLLLFEHGREALNRLRGRGILRSWALQSRRHQRSGAPVAPQNSERCACYIWTTRAPALCVTSEWRGIPLRHGPVPLPLDRGKPNL